MGPYYQAFPEGGSLTIYEDDEARTYDEIARWSKKDAEAWPKWNRWLAGIADVMGPLLTRVPPNIGSHSPVRPRRPRQAGLEEPRRRRPHGRRHHPADEHEHRRPARRLVRVAADQGRAGGQRRDRHLGRPVRARHGVRDGAPLHRRRRRRRLPRQQLGSWGYPEGGMGAVSAAIAGTARELGVEIRTSTRVESVSTSNGRATGVVLENGDQLTAPLVVTSLHPKIAFLEHLAAHRAARGLRPRHRALEHPLRRGEDQPRARPSCRTSPPTPTPSPDGRRSPEHLTGSVEMSPTMEFIERAFQDAREGRAALMPFSDGVIPTTLDKTHEPRRHAHLLDVHPVRPARVERGPAHRGARGVRRPADRPLRPGRARLRRLGDTPRHRGPARDAGGVWPRRREHLPRRADAGAAVPHAPRARLRRLPHARSPASTTRSSATHGGGGVCGIPGWQAARAAIHDKKSLRHRFRRTPA